MDDIGLYLHVSFCLRKCAYCSFYSEAGRQDSRPWCAAVIRQRRLFSSERLLTSIFFSSGTPTMLPPETLRSLLAECRQRFPCAEDAEVSIEANPATVDLLALQRLRQLGRPHTAAEAVQTARPGFGRLAENIDAGT